MALPFFKWSRTAASNDTADPTVNWAEGMAPSAVNDSARNMMASAAAHRDDTSGKLITGGSSTAYTLTSYQVFDSLANMDYHELSFFVHATNGASPTLNVDGLGAKALVIDGSATPVPTGTLIAGSCYTATYINAVNAWRMRSFYQLPFTVPLGAAIPYFGTTAPNSNFVFPYGQAISRTTYSALFTLFGTNFGSGDGSTTFNIPDIRGRIIAGKDDMGGSAASRITSSGAGFSGAGLGNFGGAETVTLAAAQIPAGVPSSGSNSITCDQVEGNGSNTFPSSQGAMSHIRPSDTGTGANFVPVNGNGWGTANDIRGTNSISVTSTNAGQTAVNKVQPTIIGNYILRII